MTPYRECFPKGTRVVVRDREFLEHFLREWRFHHPLEPSQLESAGAMAIVRGVGFYHGGDVLYQLESVPGTWHECCLVGSENRSTGALRIIVLAIVAAVVYGIAHDLVTAHLCVEYFTIGHPRVFDTESPVLLALGWGVIATWWVGLGLGLLVAFAAVRGPRPPRPASSLVKPIAMLLAAMAVMAALAGTLGWWLANAGVIVLQGQMAANVPAPRHALFIADLWAHSVSYGVGGIGGLALANRVWRSRGPFVAATQRAIAVPAPGDAWRNGLAFLAFVAAMVLTAFAVMLVVTTFATNDYTEILLTAIPAALGSCALLAFAWRRTPRFVRPMTVALVLIDLLAAGNAAMRLLGW